MVALGAGLAVLTTTALVQASLSREVGQRLPGRVPAYVFIDIQPNERDGFTALRSVPGATLLQELPNLRARVVAIAGKPAAEAHVAPNVQWTLNRDRGLTYEAEPPGQRLVAGEWWPPDYKGSPLVSIDDETAQGYGVRVGDTLTFNVLGRPIEARIANIRPEIDWSSGRVDFLFVMSPGLLEAAPHTLVAAVDVPPDREDALVNAVADAAPNVTPIPVREAVEEVARSVRKIGLAVDAVAGVTLLAGILVLAAGVASVRDRHRYQAVVLKAIGATRPLLTCAFLLEYGRWASRAPSPASRRGCSRPGSWSRSDAARVGVRAAAGGGGRECGDRDVACGRGVRVTAHARPSGCTGIARGVRLRHRLHAISALTLQLLSSIDRNSRSGTKLNKAVSFFTCTSVCIPSLRFEGLKSYCHAVHLGGTAVAKLPCHMPIWGMACSRADWHRPRRRDDQNGRREPHAPIITS